MVLPSIVELCDAIEINAINSDNVLSLTDLGKRFFPGQDIFTQGDDATSVVQIKEALELAKIRSSACGSSYPFEITDRTISLKPQDGDFNVYLFLLLGEGLKHGESTPLSGMIKKFERFFDDIVCWSLRKSGFLAEVISIPRPYRGLKKSLTPALEQISDRFGKCAILDSSKILSTDNDLDTDIVATLIKGNGLRPGWPSVTVQCATGKVSSLQSKIEEGSKTFSGVWSSGFSQTIRAGATHHDLLVLNEIYWNRLCSAGWVIDRTRIAFMSQGNSSCGLPKEVIEFWRSLWTQRAHIDWQTSLE